MTLMLDNLAPQRSTDAGRRAKAPFAEAVLMCGKCARKLPERGGKQARKALKVAAKDRRGGKLRVVETCCLDLCPKHRLVLASWRTLADRRLLVVQPGFDAHAALDQLIDAPLAQD